MFSYKWLCAGALCASLFVGGASAGIVFTDGFGDGANGPEVSADDGATAAPMSASPGS
jgi:hypothetical protein